METEFKVGDKVQLKSGGPLMTVSEINPKDRYTGQVQNDKVQCTWFDPQGKDQYREFIKQTLSIID